jgi:hypothetical protein
MPSLENHVISTIHTAFHICSFLLFISSDVNEYVGRGEPYGGGSILKSYRAQLAKKFPTF